MPKYDKSQLTKATWLLQHSSGRPEDNIRSRIGYLLESLGFDNEITYRTPFAPGPCDIYLPCRRDDNRN